MQHVKHTQTGKRVASFRTRQQALAYAVGRNAELSAGRNIDIVRYVVEHDEKHFTKNK